MNWTKSEQIIFDCVLSGLNGLRHISWLTDNEYYKIVDTLQSAIDSKNNKE